MFVCILGRQPEISLAELMAVFGKSNVSQIAPEVALVDSSSLDLTILGGTMKYGQIVQEIKVKNKSDKQTFWQASREIIDTYQQKWQNSTNKVTLGLSVYNFNISPRDVQKTGLLLKSALKKTDVSLRLIPNRQINLSTATSHHNKLGLKQNKVELLFVKTRQGVMIAESRGTQNIDAYARRDQARPKRDAFVGMLPPKLAQIMLNLALGDHSTKQPLILDPFCGTGVILQEALLQNYAVIGSDLNPKMIDYTHQNLDWLVKTHRLNQPQISLEVADATNHQWQNASEIDAVVCETYLGQPFSAPPTPDKLHQVSQNCNHIILEFLKNIHPQLRPKTPLCVAVPAWRDTNGNLTHLPLICQLENLGYKQKVFGNQKLIYHRQDQIVARELLVLIRQ